ncbi:hypothetical protein QUC31_010258 [Theobroma cacao]
MSTEDDTSAAAFVEEALTEDADTQAEKPPRRENFQSLSHEQDINVNDHTSTESVFHAEHMFRHPSMETPNHGSTLSSGHSIGNLNNSVEASNDYLLPPEGVGSSTEGESSTIQFDGIVPTNHDKRKMTWQDSTPPPPKLPFINLMMLGQGNEGQNNFGNQGQNSLNNQGPNTPGNQGSKSVENQGLTTSSNQDPKSPDNQGSNTPGNQCRINSVPIATGSRRQGFEFQAFLNQVTTSNYSHLNDDTPCQLQSAKLPIRRGVGSSTNGVSSLIQFDGIVANNPNKRKVTWQDSTPPSPKLRFINWMLQGQGNQGKNSLGNQDRNSSDNQDPYTLHNPDPKSPENQVPNNPGNQSPKSFENQGRNTLGNQAQKSPGNQGRNTLGNEGQNNSVSTASCSRNFKSISYFIMSTQDDTAAAALVEEALTEDADSQAKKRPRRESSQSLSHKQDINVNDHTPTESVFHAEHMFLPPSTETPNQGSTLSSGHSIGNLNNSLEASNDYLRPQETQQENWMSGSSLAYTDWINWEPSPQIATELGSQRFGFQALLNQVIASNNSHLYGDIPCQPQQAKMPIQQGVGSSTKGESSPIQFDGIVPTNPEKRKMTWQDSTPPPPKLPFINLMMLGQGSQGQKSTGNQGRNSRNNQDSDAAGNQGPKSLENQGLTTFDSQDPKSPNYQGSNTLGNQGRNNRVPLASGSRSQEFGFQALLNQVMTSNYSHMNDDTPHHLQRAKLPIQRGVESSTKGVSSPIQFDGIVPNNLNKRKMTWRDSTPPPPKLPFIDWMLQGQGNRGKNSPGNQDGNSSDNQDPNTLDNPDSKSPENQVLSDPGNQSPKSFENQDLNTTPNNQDPKNPENQDQHTQGNQDQKSPGSQGRNTPGNAGQNNSVPTSSGSRLPHQSSSLPRILQTPHVDRVRYLANLSLPKRSPQWPTAFAYVFCSL